MESQKLLEIIRKYEESSDYTHLTKTDIKYSNWEVYEIISSKLKEEARRSILEGSVEDGGFCRRGNRDADGQFYSYEKGEGNKPDKFEVGKLSYEEMEKWRKQIETTGTKISQSIENINRTWVEDKKTKKDKCDFCNKKIISEKGEAMWNSYWGDNSFSFCSSECMRSHNSNYLSLENINKTNPKDFISSNPKCLVCGVTKDKVDSWNQIRFGEGEFENYCDICFEKRNEDSKIQSEQTKLNDLKSQLQNPANSGKKEDLENQIRETENNLNRLKEENKNQQRKTQLQQQIKDLENKPIALPKKNKI